MRLPKFRGTTFEMIELVVRENDKQRFTLLKKIENGKPVWWIRANQGHTIEVRVPF
jgi:2'-phosphotransferase